MKQLENLLKNLDADLETREDKCLQGALPDFAEYRYVCGQILGLKLARVHVESLMQNLKDDDE